jgi:hypothetical protein
MVAGQWTNVKSQVRVRLDVSSKNTASKRTGRFDIGSPKAFGERWSENHAIKILKGRVV